jgi:DNA-directed RNA polymerase subunit RPC12/RpoP
MDAGKIHYFEKVESHQHREFIQAHNHCILCGSVLELRHVRGEDNEQIKEEAHCPQCEMRTRAKVYSLQ